MTTTFPTAYNGGPSSARRRDELATAHCVIVAEPGPETAAIESAVTALGPSVHLSPPGDVGEQLWRNSALRVLIARGPRAVAALLPWMAFLHASPNTATLALLDAGRGEILSALEFFDMWLPGGTAPAVAARQAVSLLALLDRQTRLSGPRRIRGVNLIIDLAREEATNDDGVRIPLTPSEYRLLAALAVQPGNVVDFGQLGAALPGHFRDADDAYNSVKVHVGRLRQKLSRTTGWDGHLVSVRGRGFLFERRLPRAGETTTMEQVSQRAAS